MAGRISVQKSIRVNMTLCFSQEQAAAVYAATRGSKQPVYVSPFVGRLDDHGEDGMDLVRNILLYRPPAGCTAWDNCEQMKDMILFERFEEQFDLPALAIDGGDGGGGKVAVIGEKHQGALLGFVPDLDAAQEQIALAAAGEFVQKDDLIALNGAALGHGAAFHNAVIGLVLHPGDEVDAVGVERREPGVVGIATVEDHDGAGIEAQRASDAALMHAAFGAEGKTGQQPLMIEQQMQLHGALGAPVLRPVEDAGAEFDQGGVQAQQFVLEAEAMRTGSFAAAAQQLIKHGAVQLPGPMLVGIGQGGALGRIGQPQVPQLAFAGGQSAANLAQGVRPCQVAEQHGHELAPNN